MDRYCPNCGKKIPRNATFCPNCGHSLLRNDVNRFQNVPNRPIGGYNNSNYYQPQSYGNNYAMGYFPGHPIRRWSFKIISIIVILAMIFCYIVFHLYYQHTMPSDMKGTTISGTKMLSAPAPAKNTKNNRSHPRMTIKDYSPTEYFYDEAFFGEYNENEPDFYSTYDSNNEFNYNTVNNASDTFNKNVQNNNTTQKQNNINKSSNHNQGDSSSSAKNAEDKIFMKPSTSKASASKSSSKNASDNSDNNASDNSNDSSDNLSDSSNNSSDSSDNSSDSNSDSNSNSSDSSNNSSDSSSNSSDSNSNSSDSNSNSSDSNNSDSNSDSNSGSDNGSDSDQSYHPNDDLFLNPLNSNSGGHQVNAQLSYTIEPHSIVVDMRLGKVQKEVTYNIEHIHRYNNNRVKFTVVGSGKYAKYHSFTFTRGSGNQYEIDAVNGSHVSAEHFNNGQLSITKGNK